MSTVRRRLTGLLALLGILGIVVGLPVLLLAVGAKPWPASLPSLSLSELAAALSSPDDGRLLLGVVVVLAWASWAFLTLSILVEVVSRLRGIRPPRLPGLRLPQDAARGLVGAALLLVVAGATAGPAAAAPSGQHLVTVTASAAQPAHLSTAAADRLSTHTVRPGESLWTIAEEHLGDGERWREIAHLNAQLIDTPSLIEPGWVLKMPPAAGHTPASAAAAAGPTVVVKPGDTLSKIAQERLGDADRWPEIAAASRSIRQPGGTYLSDPDSIDVGWRVRIPTQTPAADHRQQTKTPDTHAEPARPPARSPVVTPPTPAPTPPSQTASAPSSPTPPVAADDQLEDSPNWVVRTSLGIGALLAAGLVAQVSARRRLQQQRRRPGQSVPLPTGPAADLEQQLRATADPLSVQNIDTALRALARSCASTGTSLPVVRAARLTAHQFDLFLAEAAELPAPWTDTAESTVWTLPAEHAADVSAASVTDVPAPYPALVTIGHDQEDGHILVDLEYLGALGVAGDQTCTQEILIALAAELATSLWADDLQVTLVGAHPELEDVLQTGRIRYLPTVEGILTDLTTRAAGDRTALAAAGVADLPTARATNAAQGTWTPEIVVIAGSLTSQQHQQLERIVDDLPRVAIAAVTKGIVLGEWGLIVERDDPQLAVLAPIGLQIRPQRIPIDQYAQLLELAALTDVDEITGAPAPEPTLTEVEVIPPAAEEPSPPAAEHPQGEPAADIPPEEDRLSTSVDSPPIDPDLPLASPADPDHQAAVPPTAGASDPTTDPPPSTPVPPSTPAQPDTQPVATEPPRIRMLGPIDIIGACGPVEPTKRARLLELAAYLAIHPGASFRAIDDAIWPDRRTEDNLTTRNPATSKLRRWLGTDENGNDYLPRHQPGDGYRLAGVSTDVADWDHMLAGDAFTAPTENLEAAVALVRGAPLHGTALNRYAWAEPLRQRLIGEIVDATYELARRRLMEGRPRAADLAAVTGLQVAPAQESLWRLRLLATREAGSRAATAELIARLLAATDQYDCGLEPETQQLLSALEDPGADFDQMMANAL